MTVRGRIVAIRLSEKLEKNSKYAEQLEVAVVSRKTEKSVEKQNGNKK